MLKAMAQKRDPKKTKPERQPPGPQPVRIDWNEFDKLASYHCTQKEIADFFEISVDTLERACLRDQEVHLADFWEQKKGSGRSRLKRIQWSLAEQGSTAMAIFLGKHLLGQSDQPVDVQIYSALQKAGITKDEAIEMIAKGVLERKADPRKSYEQFVVAAGYPAPYPMQVSMMNFGMKENDARLLLGARGYGKTDYVVILGIAYEIYCDPMGSKNLIVTKSRERNAAMLKEVAQACIANGVTFEKQNANSLRVTGLHGKDHSVSAVTIKTVTLRGRHPRRVIMDDPVTEDDTSEATRTHVGKVYNEINKLCPNILIIGQPAHKYDLYAKLRPLLRKLEVPHGSIPELDHDLEAQRLAGVDEVSIQASYHLKVVNEGSTPFDAIKYVDKFPTQGTSVAWIDPSHEGGDFTAITVLRSYMGGVAVVGFTYKKAWNHCLDDLVGILKRFGVGKAAFETNALGDQPIIMLRQLMKETGIGIVGVKSVQNKHSKIMAAGSLAHLIHLSKESDAQYKKQVVEYEYRAKNDDAPDSLASCLSWVGLIKGKT